MSNEMTVEIKVVPPMTRIHVMEPDGAISVYGGYSLDKAESKLYTRRDQLIGLTGERPDWEDALRDMVRSTCQIESGL